MNLELLQHTEEDIANRIRIVVPLLRDLTAYRDEFLANTLVLYPHTSAKAIQRCTKEMFKEYFPKFRVANLAFAESADVAIAILLSLGSEINSSLKAMNYVNEQNIKVGDIWALATIELLRNHQTLAPPDTLLC